MTKHFVLNINPDAQYDWEQCILRNPITGEQPDLTALIAKAVENEPGSYLVAVSIEVKVLEKVASIPSEKLSLISPVKGSITNPQRQELVAS